MVQQYFEIFYSISPISGQLTMSLEVNSVVPSMMAIDIMCFEL